MVIRNKELKSDGKDVVIMQLQSEITSLKRSKRESNKPIKKKNTSHQILPTSGINLEDYAMDNFCRAHYANHLENRCPNFMFSSKFSSRVLISFLFTNMATNSDKATI